jgi:signal transduction histidine kinase
MLRMSNFSWDKRKKRLSLRLRLVLGTGSSVMVLSLGLWLLISITSAATRSGFVPSIPLTLLVLVVLLWSFSTYLLVGVTLQPVKEISRAAGQISANTLDSGFVLNESDEEFKEVSEAFNSMLNRLQQAFEQQGQFVADAAHELRTPIATLRTNLEVVYLDPQADLAEYKSMAATLERTLTRLERLTEDLLILATQNQSLLREEIALTPLLQNLLLELQPIAEEKGVTLQLENGSNPVVHGDKALLAQAFSNLIENGIYYNRSGGKVLITLSRKENWAIVNVADNGIGISKEEQEHIFNRFYRVDSSRARRKGGAGLGLSIVEHIVKQHGGLVRVESVESIGSAFKVHLPI